MRIRKYVIIRNSSLRICLISRTFGLASDLLY
jgi:hypothetical protein